MKGFVTLALLLLQLTPAGAACIDARGVPVVEVANYRINDVAQARRLPDGRPVIYYNPDVLAFLSQPSRTFFQYHECAHHALGHPLDEMVLKYEQEADCWAVKTLITENAIAPEDLKTIRADLIRFGRGDATHSLGEQRATDMEACVPRPQAAPVEPKAR